jgi:preprotein translocase subunit SecD
MKTRGALSFIPATLLSLVCAATSSCMARGLFAARDEGGVFMLLAVKTDKPSTAVPLAMDVIARRCDYMAARCKIERQGGDESNRIKVSISGASDIKRFQAVLLEEGKLELRPVVSPHNPAPLQTYRTRQAATEEASDRYDVVPYDDGTEPSSFLVVERRPVVAGSDLRSADAAPGYAEGRHQITFTLRPEAAARFGAWTEANVGRYLAIVLNGRARSAPSIRSRITDTGQIDGAFTKEQAEDLALVLRSGSLPAPVEVVEGGAYKP